MPEHLISKLLVIDDEPQSLELIKDALSNDGLEILTANDPQTGMEIFRRTRPEIVLLDLMMPGVHGLEVLEAIIATDPGADVILMTAHYSTESAVEAIQKGASDYLNKPLNLARLRSRISKILSEAEAVGEPSNLMTNWWMLINLRALWDVARSCLKCLPTSDGSRRISARCLSPELPGPARS